MDKRIENIIDILIAEIQTDVHINGNIDERIYKTKLRDTIDYCVKLCQKVIHSSDLQK